MLAINHPEFARDQAFMGRELSFAGLNLAADEEDDALDEEQTQIILVQTATDIRELLIKIYNDPTTLDMLHHRKFEEITAELLSSKGFDVELTKQTRDGGYDLIAISNHSGMGPLEFLVVCKRSKNTVGIEVVRSFKEVVTSENENLGIIVTTSYFSKPAEEKRSKTPYLLDFRDRKAVMEWVFEYFNQPES